MERRGLGTVWRGVRTIFEGGSTAGLADGQLLERYLGRGDEVGEAAFAALVERHGPMVLRVCRGVLREPHDAEDAFQATFLILARKAGSIRRRGSLASWLYGVARRVAIRAKVARDRRVEHEQRGAALLAAEQGRGVRPPGFWPELQEEVDRLSEKYRAVVVLCDLGGLTHEEAAGQLRVPVGTVKTRLSRARERLRGRLIRRGLAPVLVGALVAERVSAGLPAPLVNGTVRAAARVAAGRAAGVAASVAILVKGVLVAMFLAKLKTFAALGAALLSLVLVSLLALASLPEPARSGPIPDAGPPDDAAPAPQDDEPDPQKVAVETLQKSNFRRRTLQAGTVQPYASISLYPRVSGVLKTLDVDIGDTVKKDQVLAVIESPDLQTDLDRSQALVEQAKARLVQAESAIQVARALLKVEQAQVEQARANEERAEALAVYRKSELARYQKLLASRSIESHLVDDEMSKYQASLAEAKQAKAAVPVAEASLNEAKAKVKAAEAGLSEAEAGLHIAESDLKRARDHAAMAMIRSPMDGVVTERGASAGAFVHEGGAEGAAPLLTVVTADRMRVVVNVPSVIVPLLDRGDPATIRFASPGSRAYEGQVSRTAFAVDPASGSLRTEIDLEDTEGGLRPGLNAAVTITLQEDHDVLSIPVSAMVKGDHEEDEAACYRIVDGHAVLTRFQKGDIVNRAGVYTNPQLVDDGMRVVVRDGLSVGDTVIVSPGPEIKDGQAVEPEAKDKDQTEKK